MTAKILKIAIFSLALLSKSHAFKSFWEESFIEHTPQIDAVVNNDFGDFDEFYAAQAAIYEPLQWMNSHFNVLELSDEFIIQNEGITNNEIMFNLIANIAEHIIHSDNYRSNNMEFFNIVESLDPISRHYARLANIVI